MIKKLIVMSLIKGVLIGIFMLAMGLSVEEPSTWVVLITLSLLFNIDSAWREL